MTEDELVADWRDLLARYHATWCALDRALREGHGLGASEFEVLDQMADSPLDKPSVRMQELAAGAHLSQSALSRVVARLDADGFVTRNMCDTDRRGIFVELTAAGRRKHAEAQATHRSVLAAALTPA
ncbi:MarR family winged helix-turn-helix transcriptional regulator [Pseudonocardia sp. GCM10023141]|uniref:MarR family winged helix-turn-helix transcriptional regulator n=1 Tax=Pseudonocardia sp. GCM10023141 TaxID=3252653 RepID=UPI00361B4A12